jgi:hypothetical protein
VACSSASLRISASSVFLPSSRCNSRTGSARLGNPTPARPLRRCRRPSAPPEPCRRCGTQSRRRRRGTDSHTGGARPSICVRQPWVSETKSMVSLKSSCATSHTDARRITKGPEI